MGRAISRLRRCSAALHRPLNFPGSRSDQPGPPPYRGRRRAPVFALGCAPRRLIRSSMVMSTGWIVLGILVILVLFAVGAYNRLVTLSQRVGQAFADIDVQLKQRHDLVPNLVETVKGYAAHERGTLDAVIAARNTAIAAPGVEQKVAAENMLSGALRQLFALSENYPNLKANANFQQLQSDLSD